LATRILMKYMRFDRLTEHLDALPVNGRLFAGLLEDSSIERLERMGSVLGSELIKETFVFLGTEYDVDGLITHYFEPISAFSNWYTFSVVGGATSRRLMFKHPHGPKWSAFLKAYITSIIKAASGVEPRGTADDHIVVINC